jgi:hypothetical protein
MLFGFMSSGCVPTRDFLADEALDLPPAQGVLAAFYGFLDSARHGGNASIDFS